METDRKFWQTLVDLVASTPIAIDRPKGSAHPRYSEMIYPLDYGYLEETFAADGSGIDVWIGSGAEKTLTGILCTFDTLKREAEIKLLIGCTQEEIEILQGFQRPMPALFIPNPLVKHDLSE